MARLERVRRHHPAATSRWRRTRTCGWAAPPRCSPSRARSTSCRAWSAAASRSASRCACWAAAATCSSATRASPGVVLRLSEPAFTQITVEGKRVRAGTGAAVSALISAAARHGLAGLETLVGIPGTVGGALRTNAGDRAGDIGQFVRRVEVLDSQGKVQVRDRDELRFARPRQQPRRPGAARPSSSPWSRTTPTPSSSGCARRGSCARRRSRPSFQAAGRIFKNPRGLSASALIEQAGLARHARRRGRGQRPRRQLHRRPPGRDQPRRAAADRPDARPRRQSGSTCSWNRRSSSGEVARAVRPAAGGGGGGAGAGDRPGPLARRGRSRSRRGGSRSRTSCATRRRG